MRIPRILQLSISVTDEGADVPFCFLRMEFGGEEAEKKLENDLVIANIAHIS